MVGPTSGVTGIELASFVLAIIAVLGATIALAWRFVDWKSIHRGVRVDIRHALAVDQERGVSEHRVITVTAHNVGRAPVSVTGWGLRLRHGQDVVFFEDTPTSGPALPLTLQPGYEATWHMMHDAVMASLADQPTKRSFALHGFVRLGTGRTAISKKKITISASKGSGEQR
ncbi:MAG TPA: hypothetical protein VGF51_09405 [Acidimicrobiales bacterium]